MLTALIALALSGPLLPGATAAQGRHAAPGAGPDSPAASEPLRSAEAWTPYPRPVLIGDLNGREVIENTIRQRAHRHAAGAVRGDDGTVRPLVGRNGALGGTNSAAIPADAMALLGPLVVLHDLDPAASPALPVADPAGMWPPPKATIRIGLARN